jgi:UDP-glucose:(heptosyl)LPS alpha-1,3-glucosyltransferase
VKVAIIQEEVDAGRGGAETSTLEMATHLAQLGAEVTVVHRGGMDATPRQYGRSCAESGFPPLPSQREGLGEGEGAPGAEPALVTLLPVPTQARTRLGRLIAFERGVRQLALGERFDIVHAITPCGGADVYQPRGGTYPETILRSTALHPPLIRPLKRLGRALNLRQQWLRRAEQELLTGRAPPIVAALSDYVRRQVLGRGVPAERVRVIFNGVEPPRLDPPLRAKVRAEVGVRPDLPLVLFVAHNFALKGLRELLVATARARADWSLIVAGRDKPAPYERLSRKLGIAPRVRFVGAAQPIEVWYAAADAIAHPTWYDPCSRVVLEALTLGIPVVTTRLNGAAEVMDPRRHGAVIDHPTDIAGLAAGVEYALLQSVRDTCIADAPQMREKLSMARHARELLVLYAELKATKRRSDEATK